MAEQEEGQFRQSLERLEDTLRHMDAFHPWRSFWRAFLHGLARGLGLVVAVAIIVPFIIWLFGGVDWIPLLGDWLVQVVERLEEARAR